MAGAQSETMCRLAIRFGLASLSALGGWFGAWFIWEFLYSIGGKVIDDEHYQDWYSAVPPAGLVAGAVAGILAIRPTPSSFFWLVAIHGMALFLGCVAAFQGWRPALITYFLTISCFPFLPLIRSTIKRLNILLKRKS